MHSDLIQRLQDATEGSRELDFDIALSIGWTREWYISCYGWKNPKGQQCSERYVPAFSTSIDAAMTLVPEGHGTVALEITRKSARAAIGNDTQEGFVGEAAEAPTPALALCIAALKAKEQI